MGHTEMNIEIGVREAFALFVFPEPLLANQDNQIGDALLDVRPIMHSFPARARGKCIFLARHTAWDVTSEGDDLGLGSIHLGGSAVMAQSIASIR